MRYVRPAIFLRSGGRSRWKVLILRVRAGESSEAAARKRPVAALGRLDQSEKGAKIIFVSSSSTGFRRFIHRFSTAGAATPTSPEHVRVASVTRFPRPPRVWRRRPPHSAAGGQPRPVPRVPVGRARAVELWRMGPARRSRDLLDADAARASRWSCNSSPFLRGASTGRAPSATRNPVRAAAYAGDPRRRRLCRVQQRSGQDAQRGGANHRPRLRLARPSARGRSSPTGRPAHYGYRIAEVREALGVLDEVIRNCAWRSASPGSTCR